MPKRSSTPVDGNETAFRVVRTATEERDPTAPELLAEVIRSVREGVAAGEDDEAIALRVWPALDRLLAEQHALAAERGSAGIRRWQDARHPAAAELGSRGGKKGGKARAKKLSKERLSEIGRKGAAKRWAKGADKP